MITRGVLFDNAVLNRLHNDAFAPLMFRLVYLTAMNADGTGTAEWAPGELTRGCGRKANPNLFAEDEVARAIRSAIGLRYLTVDSTIARTQLSEHFAVVEVEE